MIRITQIKLNIDEGRDELYFCVCRILKCKREDIKSLQVIRRSLDARRKPELYFVYTVLAVVKNEEELLKRISKGKNAANQVSRSAGTGYEFPYTLDRNIISEAERPVIAGFGPAGMFAGYYLTLCGFKPVIIERGRQVDERERDVLDFWNTGALNPESNVLFGEGGAGTFSDGKLNTLVKDKEHRGRAVLETFVKFGADESILYDYKPHIGTDRLKDIVKNIRNEIIRLGGEVHFECMLTGIKYENGGLTGIEICEKGNRRIIKAKRLILATGHSARDTYRMLFDEGLSMEAKPFAVGFRVEHPQELINRAQYGFSSRENIERYELLGAAPYKLTAHTKSGRGVYSFCMCPGGYVVNSSSEEGGLSVNGMSYSDRNGCNANSAIIVTVTPADYPDSSPLAGIEFQRGLEKKAYMLAKGRVPVQRYGSFKNAVEKSGTTNENAVGEFVEFEPSIKGAYEWCDLSGILTPEMNHAFIEGMEHFGGEIKGFNDSAAILSGVESRTSSPVRIVRDEGLNASVKGVFPCGEGAGYAGGITSAAMDGIKAAEYVAKEIINDRA
ncbi:MAG: FAD-dependent oxidoreductase [Lachnospiraceae bacterium]|nr:FAD-dependent oxidoreductase [Lachnospiraceae bacterium]